MYIGIDFDGTLVDHRFPRIGADVPGSFEWCKRFVEAGAKLILFTMRSDGQECGDVLKEAVEHCRNRGVEFFGVNTNPTQSEWTTSPKAYCHIYIDDAAFGCPLRENVRAGGRPFVNWEIVGPKVLEMIEEES